MNNDYETILDWWSGLNQWDQLTYKNRFIGNMTSLGDLNEAHVTAIYREVVKPIAEEQQGRILSNVELFEYDNEREE